MKMSRQLWLRTLIAVIGALAALLFLRLHNASGATLPAHDPGMWAPVFKELARDDNSKKSGPAPDSVSAGHRLAKVWCKDCHAIEPTSSGTVGDPPAFTAIAQLPSTTALSLKVFFQTSHRNMPNLIITPEQADDLVNYILSLKRNPI